MFNDKTGAYDSPISIRKLLESHVENLTWLDFLHWSPTAVSELKRLATRVTKKRTRLPKPPAGQAAGPPPPQQPLNFPAHFYQPPGPQLYDPTSAPF